MDDFVLALLIAGTIGFGIMVLIFAFLEWQVLKLWKRALEEVHENV